MLPIHKANYQVHVVYVEFYIAHYIVYSGYKKQNVLIKLLLNVANYYLKFAYTKMQMADLSTSITNYLQTKVPREN